MMGQGRNGAVGVVMESWGDTLYHLRAGIVLVAIIVAGFLIGYPKPGRRSPLFGYIVVGIVMAIAGYFAFLHH